MIVRLVFMIFGVGVCFGVLVGGLVEGVGVVFFGCWVVVVCLLWCFSIICLVYFGFFLMLV